jgi:hypothetical protein
MPHTLWSASFSGAESRRQMIEDYGTDIGSFVSLEFYMSPAAARCPYACGTRTRGSTSGATASFA